ncbi:LacI family DNA-binding transcriptional regulator [Vallitalea okinawensis]|uniref:LacI family DNA-binding transcriptional regulator n=1 Tax=Vallitalea okinawensis TaxID=2078660 RepID=UPI000CFC7CCB|nr:LacI family DNA-binding transcriptional regulator [Vallitalea okinawensis]
MSVTILDVAKVAGVSKATVSRAFTNPEKVKPQTLQKILEVAKELNYSPNAIARAMKTNRTGNIGFIVYAEQKPIISNPFYALVLEAVIETANKIGYSLFISTDQDITLPTGEIMLQKKVDGVILASQIDSKTVLTFRKNKVPVVLLNNYMDLDGLHCVINDEYYGAHQVVEHLVRRGHKRIGILSGRYNPFICNHRYNAYVDVLKENGIELNYDYVHSVEPNFQDVYAAVKNLLIQKQRPTALFCNSDMIAIYAMKALIREGVKIPDDIAVAGFDDNYYCTVVEPELTSVHVDREMMGTAAVNILHKLMCGEEVEEKTVITKPKLIIRGST